MFVSSETVGIQVTSIETDGERPGDTIYSENVEVEEDVQVTEK